jgi:hypothetical protein
MAHHDDTETPHLDPSQLYEKRRTKDIYRLKTYNKILDQIYNRIQVNSRLPNSPCYILYNVPPVLNGTAKIDLQDAITYLVYQLRHSKYEVRYTYPTLLYVSWKHHETDYIINQSPIMQTMLASFEKSEAEKEASRLLYAKKSQKKVRMQMPGEMQQPRSAMKQPVPMAAIRNVLHQGGATPFPPNGLNNTIRSNPVAAPPVANASEYQPPSSFLQNIMNPPSSASKPQSYVDYLR